MSISELREIQGLMNSIISVCVVIGIVVLLALVLWFIRRRQSQVKAVAKLPVISRTAFASNYFGVVYDSEDTETDYLRYALICNGQGEELCRYEEAEGQTILGFANEDGNLYMYTKETYDDGSQGEVKWMFVPEHNELVECN